MKLTINWTSRMEFSVEGKPVPWSVPKVFRYGGCKKNPKLQAWQDTIRDAAKAAWGPLEPTTGPVALTLQFVLPRSKPSDVGIVVPVIKVNELTGKLTKRGERLPDLTNLGKAVEDALEGVAYADDVMVRFKNEYTVYESDGFVGVDICVYVLDTAKPRKSP